MTRHPERRFLGRVGEALGLPVDFAQIETIRRHFCEGTAAAD
jgi:hypothetical protein